MPQYLSYDNIGARGISGVARTLSPAIGPPEIAHPGLVGPDVRPSLLAIRLAIRAYRAMAMISISVIIPSIARNLTGTPVEAGPGSV